MANHTLFHVSEMSVIDALIGFCLLTAALAFMSVVNRFRHMRSQVKIWRERSLER